MLKLKYLFENYDLAKKVLENWEFDEDNLDDILKQFRISSNAIYPYFNKGKICFLRLAPTEEKLESNLIGELEFLDYLKRNKYPALTPIPSKSGDELLTVDTQWGKFYASSFLGVGGCQIEKTDFSDEILYAYGESLGLLHKLSSRYKPTTKKWTHNDVLVEIEDIFSEYNAPESAKSELRNVRALLKELSITDHNYGLCHYDFEVDNVFFDESKKSCNVIDFDDSMYNWYVLDIEQALDSIFEEIDSDDFDRVKDVFLSGYKSQYDYNSEDEKNRSLMRRFVNLYGYARLIRSVYDKFENEPEWLVELRKKLNGMIKAKEKSFEKNLSE